VWGNRQALRDLRGAIDRNTAVVDRLDRTVDRLDKTVNRLDKTVEDVIVTVRDINRRNELVMGELVTEIRDHRSETRDHRSETRAQTQAILSLLDRWGNGPAPAGA